MSAGSPLSGIEYRVVLLCDVSGLNKDIGHDLPHIRQVNIFSSVGSRNRSPLQTGHPAGIQRADV